MRNDDTQAGPARFIDRHRYRRLWGLDVPAINIYFFHSKMETFCR